MYVSGKGYIISLLFFLKYNFGIKLCAKADIQLK